MEKSCVASERRSETKKIRHIEEAVEILKPPDDKIAMCRSVVRHHIDDVVRTAKPPPDIPKLRRQLEDAGRALQRADGLVPEYLKAIHDHIREALRSIEWQADRLKVPKSGGPRKTGKGKPLNTNHKRAAAAAAHGLLQAWRGEGRWSQDDYHQLARLLFQAATGEDPEAIGQSIERQCRDYLSLVATYKAGV